MSDPINLKHPITLGGEEYTQLTLRRPKVRDMLGVDKQGGSDAEKEVRIFANLCEVPPSVIEELDLADYQALQGAYQDFLS
jgi:hypothetical protein